MVSAVHNALRQVGQVFGVAVLGALVYARLPGGIAGAPLSRASGRLFTAGLHHALWLSGLAMLAAAVLAAVLSHRRADGGGRTASRQPALAARSPNP